MYEFAESPAFAKYVHDYLMEEECAGLQWHLSNRPEAGEPIASSCPDGK